MSRTTQSIKNSQIALIFYLIEMFLGFVSRKVFINYIGVEVLGLNTTANNLLQFLNLAEMGIGSAIAFTLYKPLAQNDIFTIKEVVQVQGWLYKRIATIVAIGAIILMAFFPLIFEKISLPLWYAYASFGVLLYSALLTYFINYKQIVLSASQQDYKITLSYKATLVVKNVVQIFAISYFSNGYIWWLVLQFVFATLASINLNMVIKRNYPYLRGIDTHIGTLVKEKYRIVIVKVKQLFFHKMAGYVLNQTSPLIIYAFTSLTMVAVYGNYMLIAGGLTMLLQAIFNSVAAGVGNLIAQGERGHILSVFRELFTSRFFCVTILIFCLFRLIDPFITLWVGSEYLLERDTLIIIISIMYINLMRSVVDNFIFGYGLFKDIWAPVVESILNISLSIIFGYLWGITGILSGVLVSLILIVFIWKPFFLFKYGMKVDCKVYLRMYLIHFLICAISMISSIYILSLVSITPLNYFNWILLAVITFFTFAIIQFILLYVFTSEMRRFTVRCLNLLHNKR